MRLQICLTALLVAGSALGAASARERPQATHTGAEVRTWVDGHQPQIVGELVDLLAIPNVASDKTGIRRNAERLKELLTARGFSAETLDTAGNPLVYGDLRVPGASRTLLFYCHYDGQPVAAAAWKQPSPFTPVLRRGRLADAPAAVDPKSVTRYEADWRLYARSASDDKAPIVALLSALDALKAAGHAPTSNVRVVLDGEEEASSPSLLPAIARYRDKLRADLMIILDGPAHSSGRPTIAYGARGIATLDLTVYGPKSGVHSGNYGNWIPNPAQRLASLLASMKDGDGRVTVDGFYDGIAPLTSDERAMLDAVPADADRMLHAFGVAEPERAFAQLQRALQYPTLNVRGLVSAHVGAGARTIIPDRATAALDLRLVKETPSAALVAKLRAHIEQQGYHLVDGEPDDDVRARYGRLASLVMTEPPIEAFRTDPATPLARALADSIRRTTGQEPVQLRTLGGTVPIAPFIQALGFPAVIVPTVNFDNNQHEENENLRIGAFFDAIVTVASVLLE